ncbi:MAG: hypothetical protein ACRETD_11335 [Steroidobacteraceae bacterium]
MRAGAGGGVIVAIENDTLTLKLAGDLTGIATGENGAVAPM